MKYILEQVFQNKISEINFS